MASATITLPGGRKATINGPSREAIIEKAQALKTGPQGEKVSVGETLGRSGFKTFLDNFFELPEDAINLVNQGINRGAAMAIPGAGAMSQMAQRFGQRPTDVDLPNPQAEDVMAGAQLAGETAGAVSTGDFGQFTGFEGAKQQQAERTQQGAEQNPVASMIGSGVGDAATIATGRAPIAQQARNFRLKAQPAKPPQPGGVAEDIKGIGESIAKSEPIKKLTRTFGRSAEAGIEGAVLGVMNDSDPKELAALGAGSQAAGLMITGLAPNTLKGNVKLGAGIFGLASLARLAQEFSPGVNNSFAAIDFAYEKTSKALALGAVAGLLGIGGRMGGPKGIGGRLANRAPDVADAITAIPRDTALSVSNRFFLEEQNGSNQTESALTAMAQNPTAFSNEVRKRIQRAIKSNKVPETIDSLMKNKKFREKVQELQ